MWDFKPKFSEKEVYKLQWMIGEETVLCCSEPFQFKKKKPVTITE